MNVCWVFSLESPHRGDSNEYTQYTIFHVKTKIILNYPKSAAMGFCSKGPKNEFGTAVVNEPSVFEPLKLYCINTRHINRILKEIKDNKENVSCHLRMADIYSATVELQWLVHLWDHEN